MGASQGCCQQAKAKQSPDYSHGMPPWLYSSKYSVLTEMLWKVSSSLMGAGIAMSYVTPKGQMLLAVTGDYKEKYWLHHPTGLPPPSALLAPLREASKLPGCLRKLLLSLAVSFGPGFLSSSRPPCPAIAGKAMNANRFILQVFNYSEAFD